MYTNIVEMFDMFKTEICIDLLIIYALVINVTVLNSNYYIDKTSSQIARLCRCKIKKIDKMV